MISLALFIARDLKVNFPEIRPTPETLSQVIETVIAEHEKANVPAVCVHLGKTIATPLCQHCGKTEAEHGPLGKICRTNQPTICVRYNRFTPADPTKEKP